MILGCIYYVYILYIYTQILFKDVVIYTEE